MPIVSMVFVCVCVCRFYGGLPSSRRSRSQTDRLGLMPVSKEEVLDEPDVGGFEHKPGQTTAARATRSF